jgi:hypothetical protein
VTTQQFGAIEQLTEVEDTQEPGSSKRRVVHGIRTCKGACMGRGGFCPLRHAAGFHDDDRLEARSRACGRHEFSCVRDGLYIEEDRTRLVVQREIVQQIGNVDIELVADRNNPRIADRSFGAPIDHGGRDRARLGDQRQRPRRRMARRKAGIEGHARKHHTETVRPDNPHLARACRPLDCLRDRACAVTEPG